MPLAIVQFNNEYNTMVNKILVFLAYFAWILTRPLWVVGFVLHYIAKLLRIISFTLMWNFYSAQSELQAWWIDRDIRDVLR